MSSTSEGSGPLFTVVVLDHGAPTLLDCLASLEEAVSVVGPERVEKFVVTDAEHLPLPVREAEHLYPETRVKVVPASTAAAVFARYASSLGRGRMVALVDSTAVVDSRFLERAAAYEGKVNLLGLAPAVFLTGSFVTGALGEPLWSKVCVGEDGLPEVRTAMEAPCPSLACFAGFSVYRRVALESLGGIDPKAGLSYDFDLCFRGWSCGLGILHEPGMVMRCVPVAGRLAASRPLGLGAAWSPWRRFVRRVMWRRFLHASGLGRGLRWRWPSETVGALADAAGWMGALFGRRYPQGTVPPEKVREITGRDRLAVPEGG